MTVLCNYDVRFFYGPALKWRGAFLVLPLSVCISVLLSVTLCSSVLVVFATPTVLYRDLKLDTHLRHALNMCIKETEL